MKMIGAGPPLRGKVYRADQGGLKLPSGGYPLTVEYKDFVDLAQIKTTEGKPYTLHPGMELEYWLEARDACDYLQPNVSQSKHFRVLVDRHRTTPRSSSSTATRPSRKRRTTTPNRTNGARREAGPRRSRRNRKQEKREQEARKTASQGQGQTPGQRHRKPGDKGNRKKPARPATARATPRTTTPRTGRPDQAGAGQAAERNREATPVTRPQDDKAQAKNDKPGGESKPGAGNQGQGEKKAEDKKDGPKEDKNPANKRTAARTAQGWQSLRPARTAASLMASPTTRVRARAVIPRAASRQDTRRRQGRRQGRQGQEADQANKPA